LDKYGLLAPVGGHTLNLCLDESIVGPWVCERAGGTWFPGRGTAIGKLHEGKLQAGVLYEDYNRANVVCHIAGEGNWATKGFLGVIFDYPFNQMKVNRITVPVNSDNFNSINLVTRMGFELECTLAQATLTGDLHLFRMWRDDCRYIKGKYALPSS
jgi:RimJ/RimL family protein N-acetyltransferase